MTDVSAILSLRRSLRACDRCPIHANTGGPIPFSGDTSPTYAVLGEAPGRTEAQRGLPFVGDSGAILRHWLKGVGIDPDTVTYLNSVACWPNRSPATPTDVELRNCRPWVNGQLEAIRPQVLITMGIIAYSQIREGVRWPKLANVYGQPWFHPRYHFTVFSTYHPASYLRGRNKTYEKKILNTLKSVAKWDGRYVESCIIRECDRELYRYAEDGMGFCEVHAQRQGILWPEDQLT